MKILSWNVNGLRSIYRKNLMTWFKNNPADIYCFQEIKASPQDIPAALINLPSHYGYFNHAQKKGYSGVAIYSKTKPEKIYIKMGHKRFDQEGRFLRLDYPNFIIINVYLPQGDRSGKNIPYKLKTYDLLINHCKRIKNKPLIIIGDFNIAHQEIDLARPKNNQNNTMFTPAERRKITEFLQKGFLDTFRHLYPQTARYTWWPYFYQAKSRNIGWRLDYCFISKHLTNKLQQAFIQNNTPGSDHCPIGIKIKI